jgi:hypothetical protein
MGWETLLTNSLRLLVVPILLALTEPMVAQASSENANTPSSNPAAVSATSAVAGNLGIAFVDGSSSQVLIQRNGGQYIVDVAAHTVREVDVPQSASSDPPVASNTSGRESGWSSSVDTVKATQGSSAGGSQSSQASAAVEQQKKAHTYTPGDDLVFNVPTGRRLDRHGFYINFTHRFPFESAFMGTGRGNTLLGLDDFSLSSFGFRFGVTSKLSVMAYRSPSLIGRPIELMAAYNFLDEKDHQPLNAAVRLSIDGQNHFANNFTENIELTLSRSLGHRAQLYAVPTFSIRNRPLLENTGAALQDPVPLQSCKLALAAGVDPALKVHPCANTFSLGIAAAVDVRPTVALVAEAIPTLANGTDLGIHRSPFSFGIQKKIWRHAFTLGFTNSPGTIVSNRAGTNATFLQQPGADKPSAMFIGFDLTRQVY